MPDPQPHPDYPVLHRTARLALGFGLVLTLLKFAVFALTNATAVLTDALESIINVAAALVMLYSIWLSNRPADEDHPYGHGKVEFLAAGFEGWLILAAGLLIGYEAVQRLIHPEAIERLDLGLWLLGGVGGLSLALAIYVYRTGKKHHCLPLIADGKHLFTDVLSTLGVIVALLLVRWTGYWWLDPVAAIVMAILILRTSWGLLWDSAQGLMDRHDPHDDELIRKLLDDAIAKGEITGYHKVRHRHAGAFHWVDLHLQVDGDMTVRQGHRTASLIERRIEVALGHGNATAHVEPDDALKGKQAAQAKEQAKAQAGEAAPAASGGAAEGQEDRSDAAP